MRSLSFPLLVTPTFFDIFVGVKADQEFTSVVFQLLTSLLFLLEGGSRVWAASLFGQFLRCPRPGALLYSVARKPGAAADLSITPTTDCKIVQQ